MAAPPEKRQRTGVEAPEEEEQPAEEAHADAAMEPAKETEPEKAEPPKELEEDAAPDKSPKVKDTVNFPVANTTLNVMQSMHGNLLMTLCDGGVQHLLAGSKANVGVKSGRYMFEVKIVECMNPVEDHSSRSAPRPRNILRVGFSTESASLLMGESSEGFACFESEGAFIVPKKKTPVGGRFGRDDVVSVLLNLDEKSPNHNTMSLFKDGVRITPPRPLPEALHGEVLFPTVSFKQMTVHVNFGPEPIVPLPFKCRMLSDINVKDAKVSPAPKDGKKEVVFPVGLPDEGAFDWLDLFHKNNPGFCELSDRMILDWAEKSGIWRQKKAKTSNDKPEMGLGIKEFDEGNVRKVLHSVAPLQARNFVVMELKGNLTKTDRKDTAKSFPANVFKKSAVVLVGEPSVEFKKRTTEILLQQKQEQADAEWKTQKAEEKRQKMMQKKAKELEKAKKRVEKERKKAEKEMRKKLDAEKKAREAAEKGEQGEGEEKKEEDVEMEKEEEAEEEEVEEPEEPEEEEQQEEEPPKVELTAEEKKVLFVKQATPDLTPYVLSTSLANFTLPEKDDGFDEIKYEWSKQIKAQEYMKTWIADKKLTTRVEDLTPSDWFQSKWAEWQKALQLWHAKHGEYKAMVTKKEAAKAAKKAAAEAKAKQAAAKEAAKQAKEEAKEAARKAKEEARAAAEAEGREVPDEAMEEEEKEPEEEEKKEEEKPEEEEEEVSVDFENLDVFGVNDIMDVGGKMPLFKDFQFEDWTMMGLRFELHLLAHAFRHDVEDAERSGIHVEHLSFYYNKYYKKALSYKYYGVESFKEVVDMVNDAVYLTKKQVLESQLDAEMECMQIFPKLAEEARRYRLLKLALGDESARLKLTQPMQFPAQNRMPAPGGAKGRGVGQKGWYGDGKGGQKGGKPYGPMYQSYSNGGDRSGPWGWGQSYGRQSWNDGKGKGK